MDKDILIGEWELNLQKRLEKLKECQQKRDINSCFKCNQILGCEIRKLYVKAVYESMNKGQSGGFEF